MSYYYKVTVMVEVEDSVEYMDHFLNSIIDECHPDYEGEYSVEVTDVVLDDTFGSTPFPE